MATTYYVATNGNDGWAGTEQQPFRTIQRGINVIVAGDTLLIKNGTYVEELNIGKSGTANAPLTIKAYPDHKPVIDGQAGVNGINNGLPAGAIAGTNPNTGAGFKYEGLLDITGSHVILDGIELTRSMGRGMRILSNPGQRVESVTIRNCNVNYSRDANILFFGSNDGTSLSVSNVTVEGCDLSWAGNFYPGRRNPAIADWPGALKFKSVENCIVRNCVVHENWGEPILVDSNDGGSRIALIEDNICYDNMSSVYLHAVTDATVQRNFVYRSSTDRASSNPFGPTVSIAVSSSESPQYKQISSENIKIFNNIVVGSGIGINVRGSAEKPTIRNVEIAHNTVIDAGIDAYCPNKENIVYRNNIVYSSDGTKLVVDGGHTQTEWTYSNNLWSSRPSALNGPDDVIGDPKFRNYTGFPAAGEGDPVDYQILPDSPAIDAGFVLAEPKNDYFKNLRVGTPDIGGHEQAGSGFIQADFEATPVAGTAPLPVAFQDTSSSSAPITAWLWDFGDGTISGQQNPTHVYNNGDYTVSLRVTSSAGNDTVVKTDLISASVAPPTTPPRVTDGLQILYRFNEGSGRTVHDVSGEGAPLDLQILDLSAVNWFSEGLSIVNPTMVASTTPAVKLYEACRVSNEITVEAWLKPINTTQTGPARIVSVSQNAHSRNVTLGQGLWGSMPTDLYDVRLRTTERSANGMPSFYSPPGTLAAEKSHIVFTRTRTGASRIYRDGMQIAETIISGDFSTWNPRFPLLLANETTSDYPWLGDLYLVAVYDRALVSQEVRQNFEAGISTQAGGGSELPVLLPVFKRFYITQSNGTTILSSEKQYATFGVQYPDRRCVTCVSNGDQTLTVHESIEATLRSYGAQVSDLHWLD